MALAKRMASGNQGDRLLVIHRHAGEGLADVVGSSQRIGLAIGAFGIDVDQPHLHRGERVVELPLTLIPLRREPLALRPPGDVVLRLPDIGTPAAKAKGLKAHRLQRHVAGEDHQIGPGDSPAILLLDRPEQPAGLVEVGIVGPAVERGESLGSVAGPATSVRHSVGAGTVPGHADEERAVVAVVGRPPVLRGGHQLVEVVLDRRQVELSKGCGVVEVAAQRISGGGVLMQDVEVDLLGPPVGIGHSAGGGRPCGEIGVADHRAGRGLLGPAGGREEQGGRSRGCDEGSQ